MRRSRRGRFHFKAHGRNDNNFETGSLRGAGARAVCKRSSGREHGRRHTSELPRSLLTRVFSAYSYVVVTAPFRVNGCSIMGCMIQSQVSIIHREKL